MRVAMRAHRGRRPLKSLPLAAVVLVWLFTSGTESADSRQASTAGAAPAARVATPPTDSWADAASLSEHRVAAEGRALFASSEPLVFTLMADFNAVQRDRALTSTTTFPATAVVSSIGGGDQSFPLRIRTRGNSRRKPGLCTFAPLRLEFDANPVGTVFEGHTDLKLGTHCRDTDLFEEYVLREYAVYRMHNVLTPRSFRARLAHVRYVDAKSKKVVAARAGLFIEDDDDVARRLEGRASNMLRVPFFRTDMDTTMLMTLFEYMIGNTDMSILALHNVRLVETPSGGFFPIPYDFDSSGVVNARYARPGPQLRLASVRERLYRGPCRTGQQLEEYFTRFRAARAEMLGVYDKVPNMNRQYVREARAYLDEFFRTITRPDRVTRAFIDGCGGRAGM